MKTTFTLPSRGVAHSSEPVFLLLRRAQRAFLEGDEEAARSFLDRVRAEQLDSLEKWKTCGQLNELLARPREALSDYERALRADPKAWDVRVRKARLMIEMGSINEAREEIRLALQQGAKADFVRKALGPLLKSMEPPEELAPEDIDQAFYEARGRRKALERFLELFRGRQGAYARQWFDPRTGKCGYYPILEPLSHEVLEAHLQGRLTIGVYLLDADCRVKFAALDLDLGKEAILKAQQDPGIAKEFAASMGKLMGRVRRVSTHFDLPVVFEKSGYKGVHAWYFFEEPVPAWAAKKVLEALRDEVSPIPEGIRVEVFPKQVTLTGKGYGNLIKLPLGIHRVTKRRSVFLDERGKLVNDALAFLWEIQTIPVSVVMDLARKLAHPKEVQIIPLRLPIDKAPRCRTQPNPPQLPLVEKGPLLDSYGRILEGCSVVRYLVRKARDFGHLTFDERKVILGVLGHLPNGEVLVHHVISRCHDYDPQITEHFISRMPASPLGCRSIRRRLFYLDQSKCKCQFNMRGKEYPTPLLHLQEGLRCSS